MDYSDGSDSKVKLLDSSKQDITGKPGYLNEFEKETFLQVPHLGGAVQVFEKPCKAFRQHQTEGGDDDHCVDGDDDEEDDEDDGDDDDDYQSTIRWWATQRSRGRVSATTSTASASVMIKVSYC